MTPNTNAPADIREPAPAEPVYSADEIKCINTQTLSLASLAATELTARTLARVSATEGDADERAALLERMRENLREAMAGLADPRAERQQLRFACDALRLYRICSRPTCRKAQACRNAAACYSRAGVPEPVSDWVASLMLAARLPWMRAGNAPERLAYEGWIAGIEARRGA